MCQQAQACSALQVQECLDALAAGKEWQLTRRPQLLEDGDETEVSSSAPNPALLLGPVACSTLVALWLSCIPMGGRQKPDRRQMVDLLLMLLHGYRQVIHHMCWQAMLAPLHQGMSEGDVIHEKGSGGLLEFVMGSALGKGVPSPPPSLMICTHSRVLQQCVFNPHLLCLEHLLACAVQVQSWSCWFCCW